MRCSSYCTASEYNLTNLSTHFQKEGIETKNFDDVIYLQIKDRTDKYNIEIFVFSFGCVSIWGGDEIDTKAILKKLASFEVDKIDCVIFSIQCMT